MGAASDEARSSRAIGTGDERRAPAPDPREAGTAAVMDPSAGCLVQDSLVESGPVHLPGLQSRQVDLDHRKIAGTHLRALLAIDGMVHEELDGEFEALMADERIGLKRADPVLRQHHVERIDAGLEHRLANALRLQHQCRQRQRPRHRQQFLRVTVKGGLAGAPRVGAMREMAALIDRPARRQDFAAVETAERAPIRAEDG